MKLYLYNKNTLELFQTVEGEVLTKDSVKLSDGGVMILPGFIEASREADLSESLLSDKALLEPDLSERVALLEEMLMDILYGGEIYAE